MPNLLQTELADDLKQVVEEIGHDIEWKKTTYRGIVSDPDVAVDLEVGGFMPQGEFRIKIPRSAFNEGAGPYPAINDRIVIDDEVYKIISLRNKVDSAYVIMSVET